MQIRRSWPWACAIGSAALAASWFLVGAAIASTPAAAPAGPAVTPAATPATTPAATPATGSIPLRLPADALLARSVRPDSAVVFSHRTHVQYEGNSCLGCHPKLFRILGPAGAITHREMDGGASCGACHDGEKAFGVQEPKACATCHTGRKSPGLAAGADGVPAVARLPKPFFYPRGGDSPGLVTFKHETHGKDKAGCAACHPKLFPMKVTPARPDGAMHEVSSCGACHDGKKAFDVENPDLCDRCHVEPRGGAR